MADVMTFLFDMGGVSSTNGRRRRSHHHCVQGFDLDLHGIAEIRSVFVSFACLGVRKSDETIRRLGCDTTGQRLEEDGRIDERPLDLDCLDCARNRSLHNITFENVGRLGAELATLGTN
ncbi:MAG: hypothetical protein GWP04_08190 [Gammaproteobacteria bacterium]|nr:hypothetical protein [Gammaproteobacteria bacterium]